LRPTVRTPDSEPAITRAEFAAERPRVLPLPDDALLRPDFDLLRAIRPELSHDTTPGQAGERPPLESGPELATLAIDNGTQAPDAGRESRQAVEKPAPEPPTDRPLRGRALVAVAFAAICAMGYYLYGTFLEDPPQPSADVANSQTPRHLPIREAATMATTSPAPIDRPDAAQAEALRVTVPAAVDRRDPIERPVESRTAAVRPEGHQPAAAPTAALPAAPPKRSVAASAPGGEVHRKRPDAAASPVKRVTECTEAIATLGLCTANPNLEAR
jgi:hypothetical protein